MDGGAAVPMTPDEVRAVRFTTTRMRVGYEMAEVDDFLDAVDGTITALMAEAARARDGEAVLRTQLEQVQRRVEYLEGHPEFRGDAASVMRIAQATANEIIARARAESAGA